MLPHLHTSRLTAPAVAPWATLASALFRAPVAAGTDSVATLIHTVALAVKQRMAAATRPDKLRPAPVSARLRAQACSSLSTLPRPVLRVPALRVCTAVLVLLRQCRSRVLRFLATRLAWPPASATYIRPRPVR